MSKELREAVEKTMEDGYFVYDSDAGYFETFKTEAEALDDAKESISTYLDGEWDAGVENIVVGKITHEAKQTNLQKRPSADKLDENDCDEDGVLWSHDFHCDYEMIGLKAALQAEPVEQEPVMFGNSKELREAAERACKEFEYIEKTYGCTPEQLASWVNLQAAIDAFKADVWKWKPEGKNYLSTISVPIIIMPEDLSEMLRVGNDKLRIKTLYEEPES